MLQEFRQSDNKPHLKDACVQDPRDPLAFTPLTDHEKKLFLLPSANPEKRLNHSAVRLKNPKRRDDEFKNEPDQQIVPRRKSDQDLWDMPTEGAGLGSFGADGTFGSTLPIESVPTSPSNKELPEKLRTPIRNEALPSNYQSPKKESLFFQESSVFPKDPIVPQRIVDDPKVTADELSKLDINRAPARPVNVSTAIFQRPFDEFPRKQFAASTDEVFRHQIPDDYSRLLPPGISRIPAIVNSIPQKWVYKDPEGKIQGPFSAEQMQGWYKSGYFPPDLPIKSDVELKFIPLFQFIEKYGQLNPFQESILEKEKIDSQNNNEVLPKLLQNDFGFQIGGIVSGSVGLKDNVEPVFGRNHPALVEQQGYLYQMQQQNLQNQPQTQHIVQQHIQPHIQKQARPEEQSLSSNAKSPGSSMSSPGKSSAISPQLIASPVYISNVIKNDPPSKGSPVVFQSSPAMTMSSTRSSKENGSETSAVKKTTTMAPWSSPLPTESALSMKEICDSELAKHKANEKRKEIENKRRVFNEVQDILAIQDQTPAISQSTWASKTVSPGSNAKKSLQEIMVEEENNQRDKGVKVVGGFADRAKQAGGNTGPIGWSTACAAVTRPPAPPAVVAAIPPLIPHVKNKPAKAVKDKAILSTKNVTQSAMPLQDVINKSPPSHISNVSSVSNVMSISPHGASEELIIWCRNALRDVRKEASFSVDSFITLLLSLGVKDYQTVKAVCDDSLGGYTAIDPHKFAEAFIQRRRLDMKGGPREWSNLENSGVKPLILTRDVKPRAEEWIPAKKALKGKLSGSVNVSAFPNSENPFHTVVPKAQKKKSKGK